jgi:diguanylate cyclase (GGDEF)-like protein
VARARRDESKVAVIFIDLDGFKPINDTQGHETGDWLLKAVAQRLSECLREYDTAARLGGDEFVVLLPSLTQSEDAAQIAERIRATLALPFFTNDKKQLEISASLGVSIFPATPKVPATCCRRATRRCT